MKSSIIQYLADTRPISQYQHWIRTVLMMILFFMNYQITWNTAISLCARMSCGLVNVDSYKKWLDSLWNRTYYTDPTSHLLNLKQHFRGPYHCLCKVFFWKRLWSHDYSKIWTLKWLLLETSRIINWIADIHTVVIWFTS